MTAAQWGIVLNETGLYSNSAAGATDWWITQRHRFETTGRLRVLTAGVLGDTIEIGPLDRDDAQFARDHMIEHGIHKGLLKLRRWKTEAAIPAPRRSRTTKESAR